ncbi:hypothetical protein [Chryseobacterium luquanense]|uniref:Bulb-type lectin domain-containing protein n=1 Tax=Chryseobacterium luquanense TaxID=2983766 RepID=A0ABT3XZF6_9FLAO|nr:hypothetical protein [Chryseobacterium luquanense]MCX8531229.1 hypothetical protein [Chryseobacterium luquanense]
MIKKLLLGTLCIAQFSLISANDLKPNPKNDNGTGYFQNVPKTVIIKTKKFKVRIDKQPNGNYLYQSWGANTKITSKPSMIISDGELIPDGSGGNYYFEFNNNGTLYQVWRNYLTASAKKAPYTLVVIDGNGETLVSQDAQVVKN